MRVVVVGIIPVNLVKGCFGRQMNKLASSGILYG